jgi:hypothetical protein
MYRVSDIRKAAAVMIGESCLFVVTLGNDVAGRAIDDDAPMTLYHVGSKCALRSLSHVLVLAIAGHARARHRYVEIVVGAHSDGHARRM